MEKLLNKNIETRKKFHKNTKFEALDNFELISDSLNAFMQKNSKIRNIPSTQLVAVNSSVLRGVIKEIPISEGVHLSYTDAELSQPFALTSIFRTESEIDLSFTFSGSLACKVDGSRREIGVFDRASSVSIFNGDFDMRLSIPQRQNFKFLKLRFTRESFDKYCKYAECHLPAVIFKEFQNPKQAISQCTCILPKNLNSVAYAIVQEILLGGDSSYLLQELCVDFTCIIVNHLHTGFSQINPKRFVSYKDIEKVREAYFILSENLSEPPKLIELAHLVGLNDYKLKTGFRQAYGTSVHQCLTNLRLKKAKVLIKEQSLSVTEAALAVGYGNLGDFSQAFKRKYGVSPNSIKKKYISS